MGSLLALKFPAFVRQRQNLSLCCCLKHMQDIHAEPL